MRALLASSAAFAAQPAFAQAAQESTASRVGYWVGIALFIFIVYRLINRKRG